jgi:hypothetical protein
MAAMQRAVRAAEQLMRRDDGAGGSISCPETTPPGSTSTSLSPALSSMVRGEGGEEEEEG